MSATTLELRVAAVSQATEDTFEDTFPALWKRAFRLAYRLLGNRAAAEEIAQEALARAYSRWSSVEDHAEPWVVRVAYNLVVDETRRVKRDRSGQAAETVSGDPRLEERLDLRNALQALPKRRREVIVLRYLADQSEQDTARTLGLSPATVRRHTALGVADLRAALNRPDLTSEA